MTPDPAADQERAGKSVNGSGSAEFALLRELLVGPEREQLATIQERVGNPEIRAVDLAEVLPAAIRSARAKALREALDPVFEKSLQNSVQKRPKVFADVIYPVMGPSIRSSIAASIKQFAENLNQIVEKSVSLRAIRWRIEAKVTGKSFSEILLTKSLLYRVEQVFLIHRKSGLLLQHVVAEASVLKDADMISGMLTAVQDFFSDSFTTSGQDLETLDSGAFKLWIQYGPKALVVGAVSGTAPAELKNVFRNAVDQIHENLYAALDSFRQDDLSVFETARPMLEVCLLGQSATGKKRQPVLPWLVAAGMIVLAAAGLIWYRVKEQRRWDDYFAALRSQPGIVVTDIEKRPPGYVVAGMKDPKAPDPLVLLREKRMDAGKIRYEWQPYLSLNTKFAAEREREDAQRRIGRLLIRFEVGSSKLPLADADKIAEVAELLREYPDMRLTLTGRADDIGSDAMNEKLSMDRVNRVIDALAERGIAAERLQARAVGEEQPLRSGGSDMDRTDNRSVQFTLR